MKISPNSACPCHSGEKYKICCHPYHKGSLPSSAEKLMRSRYSAFALGLCDYIMVTTHTHNPDYTEQKESWRKSILEFSHSSHFIGLKILEFIDDEREAFVTFEAQLDHGILKEKSRFLKIEGKWLYESGNVTSMDRH
jgi:SEC-C motif domain protein